MNTQSISTRFIEKLLGGLFVIMIAFLTMTATAHAAGSTHGITLS